MAGGRPGVESPSYIYAVVFALFLVFALIMEKIIEGVEHRLSKAGRSGLKEAFSIVVKEVTMLGFISLILLSFEDSFTDICVKKFYHRGHWNSIENFPECAECLKDTHHLSSEFKNSRECPFWAKDGYSSNSYADPSYSKGTDGHLDEMLVDDSHHRRRLLAGSEKECPEGEEPLISTSLLHEIHIFVFFLTVVHVINAVISVVLANLKLLRWQRWKVQDDEYAICVSNTVRQVTLQPLNEIGDAIETLQDGVGVISSEGRAAGASETNQAGQSNPPARLDRTKSILKVIPESKESIRSESIKIRERNRVYEWSLSFFKQFYSSVTQEEFRIMRASFMLDHSRTTEFDFLDYLKRSLDDDVVMVVKTPISGWITLILCWVLWSPIRYTRVLLLLTIALNTVLIIVVSTKMVSVVKRVTNGGRVHKLESDVFWFSNPRLILPVIRYALFLNSSIVTTVFYLAIHYGPKSCYMYGESKYADLGYTYWIWLLILALYNFFHISFLLLPTYSLVVHMGSDHWSHHLLKEDVKDKVREWHRRAQDKTKSEQDKGTRK